MCRAIRFGNAKRLSAERQRLIGGQRSTLAGRAFDAPHARVERFDVRVGKDKLRDLDWPGRVVEYNKMQVQISELHKPTDAGATATIRDRGYGFTPLVEERPAPIPRVMQIVAQDRGAAYPRSRRSKCAQGPVPR